MVLTVLTYAQTYIYNFDTRTYIRTYTDVHNYTRIYTYIIHSMDIPNTYIRTYMCIYEISMFTFTHTYIFLTNIRTYTHTYIGTCIHIHT